MATLIITLPPHIPGGVASKAKILADHLKSLGQDVTIGFYAARGKYLDLNVNALQIVFGQSPKSMNMEAFGGHHCVAIGCKIPELENRYTEPSTLWTDLIRSHDHHMAVGGTVLVANPLVHADVKHLVWCAGDVEGDRFSRRDAMNFLRKRVDRRYISKKLKQQEKRILAYSKNRILGVSPYSLRELQDLQARASSSMSVLPIPTDMNFFTPDTGPRKKSQKPIIGFAGRLDDPRKNPDLLFRSLAAILARGHDVELHVTGDRSSMLGALLETYNVVNKVKFLGRLTKEELKDFYQSLTLFLIASHQEGLAIVGIEALACGVPVISTKCGGPEAYVRNGNNGYLCDFDAEKIAGCAIEILSLTDDHKMISKSARSSVAEAYSLPQFEKNLNTEWLALWGEALG